MLDFNVIFGLVISSIGSLIYYYTLSDYHKNIPEVIVAFIMYSLTYAFIISVGYILYIELFPLVGFKILYGLIPVVIISIGCNLDKLKFSIRLERK